MIVTLNKARRPSSSRLKEGARTGSRELCGLLNGACVVPAYRARTPVRRACEHMFVRWSNLTLEEQEQRRLPGYRDEAVVRRFDAPEALQTRFYEVSARSILNRVPERSPMPFRWTINPYRGCSHACAYCLAGDTRVLLADGRTLRLAELEVG